MLQPSQQERILFDRRSSSHRFNTGKDLAIDRQLGTLTETDYRSKIKELIAHFPPSAPCQDFCIPKKSLNPKEKEFDCVSRQTLNLQEKTIDQLPYYKSRTRSEIKAPNQSKIRKIESKFTRYCDNIQSSFDTQSNAFRNINIDNARISFALHLMHSEEQEFKKSRQNHFQTILANERIIAKLRKNITAYECNDGKACRDMHKRIHNYAFGDFERTNPKILGNIKSLNLCSQKRSKS
jgi:hypothetical protein